MHVCVYQTIIKTYQSGFLRGWRARPQGNVPLPVGIRVKTAPDYGTRQKVDPNELGKIRFVGLV